MSEPNEYQQLKEGYRMRIVLTKFLRARIQEIENENGEMEKCVCIPIEDNKIYTTKGGSALLDLELVKTSIKSRFGWTHGVRQIPYSSLLDMYKSKGMTMPFVGNGRKKDNTRDNKSNREVYAQNFMPDE